MENKNRTDIAWLVYQETGIMLTKEELEHEETRCRKHAEIGWALRAQGDCLFFETADPDYSPW